MHSYPLKYEFTFAQKTRDLRYQKLKILKKLQRDIHGGHLFSAKQENKGNIQQLRNSLREEGVVGFVTNHYGKIEGDISSTVTSR